MSITTERDRRTDVFSPHPIHVLDAELRPDGQFLYRSQAMIDRLWQYEIERGGIDPEIVHSQIERKRIGSRKIITLDAKTREDEVHIRGLSNRFREGVMQWIKDGYPNGLAPIEQFHKRYIASRKTTRRR